MVVNPYESPLTPPDPTSASPILHWIWSQIARITIVEWVVLFVIGMILISLTLPANQSNCGPRGGRVSPAQATSQP